METQRKQAPLPPNGARKRYDVEVMQRGLLDQPLGYKVVWPSCNLTLEDAKCWRAEDTARGYLSRITTRLADGRKLVLP